MYLIWRSFSNSFSIFWWKLGGCRQVFLWANGSHFF